MRLTLKASPSGRAAATRNAWGGVNRALRAVPASSRRAGGVAIAALSLALLFGQFGSATPRRCMPPRTLSQAVPSPTPANQAPPQTTGPQAVSPTRVLSLDEAVQMAMATNVAVLLSKERVKEAKGNASAAAAPLLPNFSIAGFQANETENLASLGFRPGLLPGLNSTLIGPFYSFDARIKLMQNVYNQSAILRAHSGRAGVTLAHLQERLAHQQVAATVQIAYITLLRAERAVQDASANVSLADSLLQLARTQRAAGVATGLDVTRADTQLAAEEVNLSKARTNADQAELQLQHLVGVPLGIHLVLADPLQATQAPLPTLDQALATARGERPELAVAREQVQVSQLELQAAEADYLPTVNVAADYGEAGATPTEFTGPVHDVMLQLNVPIFNGGLTRGQVEAARSRLAQSQLSLNDLTVQVEQDVRQAMESLGTSWTQVESANRSVYLSERELKMARDRFRSGLGDNIEVLTAQTALANARDAQAAALQQFQVARINLASALGQAESYRLAPPTTPAPSLPIPNQTPPHAPTGNGR